MCHLGHQVQRHPRRMMRCAHSRRGLHVASAAHVGPTPPPPPPPPVFHSPNASCLFIVVQINYAFHDLFDVWTLDNGRPTLIRKTLEDYMSFFMSTGTVCVR